VEDREKLGLTTVPVRVADLTPEQAKACRIADNQTATIADWNMDLLPVELHELEAMNFDLSLLGFDPSEFSEIMTPAGNPGLCDPDDIPEQPHAAETQPGDLWVLGEHRLLCGDSSKPEDMDRRLGGAVMHPTNLDPPNNVNVEPRVINARAAGSKALPPLPPMPVCAGCGREFCGPFRVVVRQREEKCHASSAPAKAVGDCGGRVGGAAPVPECGAAPGRGGAARARADRPRRTPPAARRGAVPRMRAAAHPIVRLGPITLDEPAPQV